MQGRLTATQANISGNINATSGTFTGLVQSSAFVGGSISIGGGTFTVSSSGSLTATQANISGIVNAQDLRINNVSVLAGNKINGNFIDSIQAGQIQVNSLSAISANLGTITAGSLFAVNINSATIRWATINGGNINVNTDVKIGNKLIINSANFGAGVRWTNGSEIYIDPISQTMFFSTGGNFRFNSDVYANSEKLATENYAVKDNIAQGIRLQVFGGRLEYAVGSGSFKALANLSDIP
jgi:hypothetical protein